MFDRHIEVDGDHLEVPEPRSPAEAAFMFAVFRWVSEAVEPRPPSISFIKKWSKLSPIVIRKMATRFGIGLE